MCLACKRDKFWFNELLSLLWVMQWWLSIKGSTISIDIFMHIWKRTSNPLSIVTIYTVKQILVINYVVGRDCGERWFLESVDDVDGDTDDSRGLFKLMASWSFSAVEAVRGRARVGGPLLFKIAATSVSTKLHGSFEFGSAHISPLGQWKNRHRLVSFSRSLLRVQEKQNLWLCFTGHCTKWLFSRFLLQIRQQLVEFWLLSVNAHSNHRHWPGWASISSEHLSGTPNSAQSDFIPRTRCPDDGGHSKQSLSSSVRASFSWKMATQIAQQRPAFRMAAGNRMEFGIWWWLFWNSSLFVVSKKMEEMRLFSVELGGGGGGVTSVLTAVLVAARFCEATDWMTCSMRSGPS